MEAVENTEVSPEGPVVSTTATEAVSPAQLGGRKPRGTNWTPSENEQLKALVEAHSVHQIFSNAASKMWEAIAGALDHRRSASAIAQHYSILVASSRKRPRGEIEPDAHAHPSAAIEVGGDNIVQSVDGEGASVGEMEATASIARGTGMSRRKCSERACVCPASTERCLQLLGGAHYELAVATAATAGGAEDVCDDELVDDVEDAIVDDDEAKEMKKTVASQSSVGDALPAGLAPEAMPAGLAVVRPRPEAVDRKLWPGAAASGWTTVETIRNGLKHGSFHFLSPDGATYRNRSDAARAVLAHSNHAADDSAVERPLFTVRPGRRVCGTPGCQFEDLHAGMCSSEIRPTRSEKRPLDETNDGMEAEPHETPRAVGCQADGGSASAGSGTGAASSNANGPETVVISDDDDGLVPTPSLNTDLARRFDKVNAAAVDPSAFAARRMAYTWVELSARVDTSGHEAKEAKEAKEVAKAKAKQQAKEAKERAKQNMLQKRIAEQAAEVDARKTSSVAPPSAAVVSVPMMVTVPSGISPGGQFQVHTSSGSMMVTCPPESGPGQMKAMAPPAQLDLLSLHNAPEAVRHEPGAPQSVKEWKAARKEQKERERVQLKKARTESEIQRVLDRLVVRLEKDEEKDEKQRQREERVELKRARTESEIQRVLDRLVLRLEKDEEKDEKQRQREEQKRKSLGGPIGKPLVELFCVCQKPHNPAFTMICCDICESWYHGKCVGLTSVQVDAIEEYVCPNCREKTGQLSSWKQGIEVSATSHRLPKALAGNSWVSYSSKPKRLWPTGSRQAAASTSGSKKACSTTGAVASTSASTSDRRAIVDDGDDETKQVNITAGRPYILFCKEQRPTIVQTKPTLSFGNIGKALGGAWGKLSGAQKATYKPTGRAPIPVAVSVRLQLRLSSGSVSALLELNGVSSATSIAISKIVRAAATAVGTPAWKAFNEIAAKADPEEEDDDEEVVEVEEDEEPLSMSGGQFQVHTSSDSMMVTCPPESGPGQQVKVMAQPARMPPDADPPQLSTKVLQGLADYLVACGGAPSLVDGFYTKTEDRKKTNHKDTYFFSPEHMRFRSRAEVRTPLQPYLASSHLV